MCDPQTILQHVGSFQLLKHHLEAQHHLSGLLQCFNCCSSTHSRSRTVKAQCWAAMK